MAGAIGLIERFNPWSRVYGDDVNHIIDILDGGRYNLVTIGTAASGARYVIDPTSIRAYNNLNTNYGAPSGAGVTFEVSPNGNVFASLLKIQSATSGPYILLNAQSPSSPGVSPYFSINDGARDRIQEGNLASYTDPRGAVSPAGYGGRVLDASGNLLWDATQTMIFMPVYTGYTPVDTTNFAIARFEITSDVVKVLKIQVSFYCDVFKVGNQTTAQANTSSAGSAHSHSVSGQSNNNVPVSATEGTTHSHTMVTGGPSSSTDTIVYDSLAAGPLTHALGGQPSIVSAAENATHSHSIASGAITISGATSTNESSHTHSIPSLTLNVPSGLYTTGGATGVHVKIYNQAGTLLADHGPYAGGAGVFVSDIDITADSTWTAGWYQVQFTSTALGGIEGQINIKATIQAG